MKKQNYFHFIGIDVSKKKFDVAIITNGSTINSQVFENTSEGINTFFKHLKKAHLLLKDCLICMEHTGVYGKLLGSKILDKQGNLVVEMALKIKRSLGLQRGKNDRIDAIRIAQYTQTHQDQLELYKALPETLELIRALLTIRAQLVKSKTALSKSTQEYEGFAPKLFKLTQKSLQKTLKTLEQEIQKTENHIQKLLLSDNQLNNQMTLACSVPGIGKITALHLMIYTHLFSRYESSKQLACYCGIAPFEHTSGSSVKKRSRVNHMANKLLKKHLHLCALAAIRSDTEINHYYHRKVDEGKSKMLVINNVRNKIIQRLCAVIDRQKPYIKVAA